MKSIDVSDLPEPMARAIAEQVHQLRQRLSRSSHATLPSPPEFMSRQGTVHGNLSREEIYADDD